jgi:hypothetical protein
MIAALVVALVLGTAGLSVWALIWAALDRPVRMGHLVLGGVLEALLVIQAIVAAARLIGGTRPESTGTFVGYLIGSLLVLPLGVLWALEERTRWSSVVLAIAGLTLVIVVLRMDAVWDSSA